MSYLPERTTEEQAKITASYLSSGRMWNWKNKITHDGFKWLRGLSLSCGRVEGVLNEWMRSLNIINSTKLIDDFERMACIPDGAMPGTGTLANRQRHVITKISTFGVQTGDRIKFECTKMGLVVEVYPGMYFYNNPDVRVPPFATKKEARNTIVIEYYPSLSDPDEINTFPIDFPYTFARNNYGVMQDHLLRAVPVTKNLIWIINGSLTGERLTEDDQFRATEQDEWRLVE